MEITGSAMKCLDAAAAPHPAAVVPSARRRGAAALAESLVSFLAPASYAADQYRTLRHAVERMRSSGVQILGITSPGAGDGKSVTALNLAGSLAQAPNARVLVVDADLRKPNIAAYLGWGATFSPGLADALADEDGDPARLVRRVPGFNVSVLPGGTPSPAAYELLSSPRFEALLAGMRREYDCVIVDTPPFAPLPDCRVIEGSVDAFLVVVAAHRTPKPLLFELLDLMDPAKAAAIVFNGDDRPPSSYYGYSGTYGASRAARTSWWRRLVMPARPAAR
jgi:capsular exopolysaccharide synthesis family protein